MGITLEQRAARLGRIDQSYSKPGFSPECRGTVSSHPRPLGGESKGRCGIRVYHEHCHMRTCICRCHNGRDAGRCRQVSDANGNMAIFHVSCRDCGRKYERILSTHGCRRGATLRDEGWWNMSYVPGIRSAGAAGGHIQRGWICPRCTDQLLETIE